VEAAVAVGPCEEEEPEEDGEVGGDGEGADLRGERPDEREDGDVGMKYALKKSSLRRNCKERQSCPRWIAGLR
jgi:hypothetical protein